MMNEMSIQVISNIFGDFSFERDRRTNEWTDARTLLAHLKSITHWWGFRVMIQLETMGYDTVADGWVGAHNPSNI